MPEDNVSQALAKIDQTKLTERRKQILSSIRDIADWVSSEIVETDDDLMASTVAMVNKLLRDHAVRTKIFTAALIKKQVHSIVDLAEDIDLVEGLIRDAIAKLSTSEEPCVKDLVALHTALTQRQQTLLNNVNASSEADYPNKYVPPPDEEHTRQEAARLDLDKINPHQREKVIAVVDKLRQLGKAGK